jgi:2-amino-4-hydroxy-6-hydroxymethyldihydropteridine diphosphokinase
LNQAWERLGEYKGIRLLAISDLYKTAPVDMDSHHWFTNGVGKIETDLSASTLLETLLQVEASFGRTRETKSFGYQDRALDLDLLYYGDAVLDTPELVLPHPRIRDRLFVLVPLLELAPEHKDPLSGETVRSMKRQLNKRIEENVFKHQEIIPGKPGE